MAEYIEREAVVHLLMNHRSYLAAKVQKLPAAEVAPVVHGHIVPAEQPKKVLLDGKCVKCNSLMLSTDKFCPSCGARMDGDGNG